MTIPSPYINDILNQPAALRDALEHYPVGALKEAAQRFARGEFDRIVVTGMGGSYSGSIPAVEMLAHTGVPVIWLETSELIHYQMDQISPRTLLWVISQSGFSAEIILLLEMVKDNPPAYTIGVTNTLDSPVGRSCQVVLPLSAGPEFTVSTKTYLNTVTVMQLAALELTGQSLDSAFLEFRKAADAVADFLSTWEERVAALKTDLGERVQRMLLVGRGRSRATVVTGSLILKEAAKVIVEGMTTSFFRHGPLELADEKLTLLVLAGPAKTQGINRALAVEAAGYGAQIVWISTAKDAELPTMLLPEVGEMALPIVEILPMQMMTIAFGELNGVQPGIFRHMGKITHNE